MGAGQEKNHEKADIHLCHSHMRKNVSHYLPTGSPAVFREIAKNIHTTLQGAASLGELKGLSGHYRALLCSRLLPSSHASFDLTLPDLPVFPNGSNRESIQKFLSAIPDAVVPDLAGAPGKHGASFKTKAASSVSAPSAALPESHSSVPTPSAALPEQSSVHNASSKELVGSVIFLKNLVSPQCKNVNKISILRSSNGHYYVSVNFLTGPMILRAEMEGNNVANPFFKPLIASHLLDYELQFAPMWVKLFTNERLEHSAAVIESSFKNRKHIWENGTSGPRRQRLLQDILVSDNDRMLMAGRTALKDLLVPKRGHAFRPLAPNSVG